MSKLHNCLLSSVFIMMLIITCLVLIFSFANHRLAIIAIRDTLTDVAQNPTLMSSVSPGQISPEGKAYVEELKNATDTIMDSNTVSFLFEVLLLCVVTVAAYLLARSNEALEKAQNRVEAVQTNLKKMENKAREADIKLSRGLQEIGQGFEIASSTMVILSYYANLLYLSSNLESVKVRKQRDTLAATIRSIFTSLEVEMKSFKEKPFKVGSSLYDFLLDAAASIQKSLNNLSELLQPEMGISDLVQRSNRCRTLLKSLKSETTQSPLLPTSESNTILD